MRLIDADKIPWTDLNDNPNSNIKVLVTFAEKVNRMPTIEERKTGKWIRGKCDQCGAHAPFWPMASTYYESDYCPNCGAEMRGDDHETD